MKNQIVYRVTLETDIDKEVSKKSVRRFFALLLVELASFIIKRNIKVKYRIQEEVVIKEPGV